VKGPGKKNNSFASGPSTTLRTSDYLDLGFAKYDLKREKIKGFPEVVLAQGKDEKHLVSIAYNAVQKTKRLLITRVSKKQYLAIKKKFKGSKIHQPVYYETARLVYIGKIPKNKIGKVVVVCAGTSDLPIAEEATFSLEIFGSKVARLYDVGVAGLHRLLSNAMVFEDANVVVV
jgi:NCAIR mutase (PurE)-related protein